MKKDSIEHVKKLVDNQIAEMKKWNAPGIGEMKDVRDWLSRVPEQETLSIDKEQLIKRIENYIPLHDKTVGDVAGGILEIVKQLPEMEVLSPEWIYEHEYIRTDPNNPFVYVDDLQNLLVPKSKEITEDLARELLKEKYEWPWDGLRYAIMQQLEEGAAEAKMTSLGYFEVEVDGIKYHVHEDAHTRIYDEAYEQGRSDSGREHEGDLPVIPQYVADCLNHGKNELGYSMYDFMHYATHLDEVKTKWKRAYEWIRKNTDKFAKAYLKNGYRTEKESEYFIKVNGKHLTTVNIADTDSIGGAIGDVEIYYEVGDPVAATRFTKKEVEYLEKYLNIEATEVKPLPF